MDILGALFYKFNKKIDEYLENENANFVIFASGQGLANMTKITQRHARKCSFDMTPVLSGYKVTWLLNDLEMTLNWPWIDLEMSENDQKCPKMTKNVRKWPKMTKNN